MIDATAIIDQSASIAEDVVIGPYTVIGPDVEIGAGCWIGPHVVIRGPCKIGRNNRIFQFASVGEAPQDKKYAGEHTSLILGDNNVVREGVTLNRGTSQDLGVTQIGNDNLFMANSHVAHDCIVGDGCVFGNSAAIAGHVHMGNYVIISGMCGVHQFCLVGSHSFIAHGTIVTKDVPPYVMVTGGASPTACGINIEGVKRHGFDTEQIQELRRAYKVLYRQGLRMSEAIEKLDKMAQSHFGIDIIAQFLRQSKRGIVR